MNQQDAVAIFISEGVSGFLGGIAAKSVLINKYCSIHFYNIYQRYQSSMETATTKSRELLMPNYRVI